MKILSENKKKKKNKFTFGWFTTLNPGDPKKNQEIFNKNMTPNTSSDNSSESDSGTSNSSGDSVGGEAAGGMS